MGWPLAKSFVFDLGDRLFAGGAGGVFGGVFEEGLVVVGTVEVGADFPDVAGHVVETVVVGGKAFDGSGGGEAVEGGVVLGKLALEGIGGPGFAVGLGLVAPDEEGVVEIAAGSALPFRFGGEAFFGPFAVGVGVVLGHADDGVVHFVGDGAVGAGGMLPVGTGDKLPPLPFRAGLPLVDFAGGGFEDEGAGFELVGGGVGKIFFGETALGLGLVAGGLDEFRRTGRW